jgi:hypothetical protein
MRALLAFGLLTASAYGASTKVPEGVKVVLDLEYAQVKGVSLKLDLDRPSAMPSVAMPALPFSPVKFSGLMERDFAFETR